MTRALARGTSIRPAAPTPARGYLADSELPLTSLVFLLPFLIAYEVGTRFFVTDHATGMEDRIGAFTLMRGFFVFLGATGRYLPALAVVGILLAWHIARNDPWRVKWGTLFGMGIESLMLGICLLVIGLAAMQLIPMGAEGKDWKASTVLSIGAGIYEELIFRLIAFNLLSLLFVDMLKLDKRWALPTIVISSAMLFAGHHYLYPDEHFKWQVFAFRSLAGVYFGTLFLIRGFGITAGSHAAYDMVLAIIKTIRV
jgi:membrane protease YdiL (CAAX protease family)